MLKNTKRIMAAVLCFALVFTTVAMAASAHTEITSMSYYAQTADVSSPTGSAGLTGEVKSGSTTVQYILYGRPVVNQSIQVQSWTCSQLYPKLDLSYIQSGYFYHYGYIQPVNPPSGQGGIADVTCFGR